MNDFSNLDFWHHISNWKFDDQISKWKKSLGNELLFVVCIAYRVWWIYLLKHILTSAENEAITRLIMQLQRWDQAFWKAKNLLIHLISTDLTNSSWTIS